VPLIDKSKLNEVKKALLTYPCYAIELIPTPQSSPMAAKLSPKIYLLLSLRAATLSEPRRGPKRCSWSFLPSCLQKGFREDELCGEGGQAAVVRTLFGSHCCCETYFPFFNPTYSVSDVLVPGSEWIECFSAHFLTCRKRRFIYFPLAQGLASKEERTSPFWWAPLSWAPESTKEYVSKKWRKGC